ncbi:MAG: hypothetical protein ACXWLP_13450 [Myxococcaceae bacterium]
MLPLLIEMLLCLVAAAVIGFLIAWFLRMRQLVQLTQELERLRATMPTGVLPSALSTRLELLARLMEEVRARPANDAALAERVEQRLARLDATLEELRERRTETPRLPEIPGARVMLPGEEARRSGR